MLRCETSSWCSLPDATQACTLRTSSAQRRFGYAEYTDAGELVAPEAGVNALYLDARDRFDSDFAAEDRVRRALDAQRKTLELARRREEVRLQSLGGRRRSLWAIGVGCAVLVALRLLATHHTQLQHCNS